MPVNAPEPCAMPQSEPPCEIVLGYPCSGVRRVQLVPPFVEISTTPPSQPCSMSQAVQNESVDDWPGVSSNGGVTSETQRLFASVDQKLAAPACLRVVDVLQPPPASN